MSTYRHILVGLDLSEDTEKVLAKAHALATGCGAKISIAHIIEPITFAYGGDVPIDLSDAQQVMQEQAKKRLTKLAAQNNVPQSHTIVRLGQTTAELHTLAKERGADLIAVGSHGRHGLALLFGSTAKGVIKGAECDVLAIKV